jgi:uncharacterized repeat protein (TIGR03803 family)
VTPAGALTSLVSFNGTDGMQLNSRLVQGSDGNFYGTTPFGGSSSLDGTVFKMSVEELSTTPSNFARVQVEMQ